MFLSYEVWQMTQLLTILNSYALSAIYWKPLICNPHRQQPSLLLYSIDNWPASNSRLTQRETNYYIARCARVSPEQLVIDLFVQHQRFAVCCPYRPMEIGISLLSLLFLSRVCRLKRHSQKTQWEWRPFKLIAQTRRGGEGGWKSKRHRRFTQKWISHIDRVNVMLFYSQNFLPNTCWQQSILQ